MMPNSPLCKVPERYRWSIGSVEIDGPLVLGPMAGYTSLPMRLLSRRAGAHLVCSEMISAQALAYHNAKTFELMLTHPAEHPVSLQLFGSDPQVMADAVPFAEAAGADLIDVNMGCTVPKIVRSDGGAALISDPVRAAEIIAAMVERAKVPITCKIRAGQFTGDNSYLDLACRLEQAGAAAVALHARTVRQRFWGEADHDHTRRLVETLHIPVIASGDVMSPDRPRQILEETGCAGVMIARGAVGRPWAFTQANQVLCGEEPSPDPEAPQRFGIAMCQAQMLVLQSDEATAMHQMRGQLSWYSKGLPYSHELRRRFSEVRHLSELPPLMSGYLTYAAEQAELAAAQIAAMLAEDEELE